MKFKQVALLMGVSERTVQRKIVSGKLSPYNKKTGKDARYKRSDVIAIAGETIQNKEKHRPDTANEGSLILPPIEVVTDKDLVIKAMKANPLKTLLNKTGKTILMDTTKYLKDTGLLNTTNKQTIMRYAIAVQMQEKYMITAEVSEAKYFHDLVKQYGADIKHYEKELGLTPAALAKIKPQEEEKVKEIDPMEALLSGK